MYTKSLIQQHREILNIKESITDKLSNLMDNYIVKDNIFMIKNLTPIEVERGYFVPHNTYDTISEAIKNMDIVRDCIRIQENKTFTVGRTYKTLSECSEYSQIFDICGSESIG